MTENQKLYSAKSVNGGIELSSGSLIKNFHEAGSCLGEHCPVHKPSQHEFRNLPLDFDGRHMIRILKDGTIVVDPDDYILNENGYAIIRNSGRCLLCNDEVESQHQHEMKSCACGNIFVDGGRIYRRTGMEAPNTFENTSIVFVKDDDDES